MSRWIVVALTAALLPLACAKKQMDNAKDPEVVPEEVEDPVDVEEDEPDMEVEADEGLPEKDAPVKPSEPDEELVSDTASN